MTIIGVNNFKEKKEFEADVANIEELMEDGEVPGYPSPVRFTFLISFIKYDYNPFTLYSLELNIDSYYKMCGYMILPSTESVDENNSELGTIMWVKYRNNVEIKDRIDISESCYGLLCYVYDVYDVLVKEDLLYNKKYNIVYKYYSKSTKEWKIFEVLKKEMILGYDVNIDKGKKVIFSKINFRYLYPLFNSDETGINMVLNRKRTTYDIDLSNPKVYTIEEELGSYYSTIIKYCKDNDDLNEMKLRGQYYEYYEKTMISIQDIKKILEEWK